MPNLYIIAGPNGAGKTTLANTLLPKFLSCNEFVNADSIAAGLSPFNVESVAMQAGRLMLERMNYLFDEKKDFAFETTLSTHFYANWIMRWLQQDYQVHLIYLWLDNVEIAIQRVRERVQNGGHFIPENIIRRRYDKGLKNLFSLYMPIVTSWEIYNNSTTENLGLIAESIHHTITIHEESLWQKLQNQK